MDEQRASDEQRRTAHSAEAAAAEDFDPLRIRPYVTLTGEEAPADAGQPSAGPAAGQPGGPAAGPPAVTGPGPGAPDAATTMSLYRGDIVAAGPLPGEAGADGSGWRTAGAYAGAGPDPVQPRRRRPFAVIAVAAAVVAVVGTAAFASGLFGADDDGLDDALPVMTTSVPETGSEPAQTVSESPSASASPSRSASPSPSASASPSRSPEPTRSASPTRVSPSPSDSRSTAPATTSAPPVEEESVTTLRRGDQGEEVSELQRRLQEVWLYHGPDDGDYSDKVERAVAAYQSYKSIESDPSGVYGPETRRELEARTSGRDRHQ